MGGSGKRFMGMGMGVGYENVEGVREVAALAHLMIPSCITIQC